jgi:hypothetical protein
MARSLIQVYALTVCFCTLMCGIVAMGKGAYDLVRVASPRFTAANSYGAWDSNEQYLLIYPDKKGLPPEEITSLREKYRQDTYAYERQSGQQGLVFALIIVVIDAAVYAIHWRIARRAEPAVVGKAV